jgi:hypothetical protein
VGLNVALANDGYSTGLATTTNSASNSPSRVLSRKKKTMIDYVKLWIFGQSCSQTGKKSQETVAERS